MRIEKWEGIYTISISIEYVILIPLSVENALTDWPHIDLS
jgi:hypothetical protein